MDIRTGQVWDPHGYRRADLCRGRSCSGDLDGRTCGRDSADSKTRKAGGDQCLLVQCLKNYGNIYRRSRNKQILRATGRKGKGFVYRKILDVAEKLSERLVSGTEADTQIRCNQIWALSMPFTMLEPEKERKIVETVFEKLYTFYGMRTLEEADPEFHPYYEGAMEKRDMAYHQGTVWTFPLGAYYLAYLKVHAYSERAKQDVKEQLEVLECALKEGCIGQLPEIYDGKNPVSSKGCFAQAWSVGELLRVYEQIEKKKK